MNESQQKHNLVETLKTKNIKFFRHHLYGLYDEITSKEFIHRLPIYDITITLFTFLVTIIFLCTYANTSYDGFITYLKLTLFLQFITLLIYIIFYT